MLYRIICENKKQVIPIVSRYFEGFTVYHTLGFWKGKSESSLVIEIDTAGSDYNPLARISAIVTEIKLDSRQETVLLQKIGCFSEFK